MQTQMQIRQNMQEMQDYVQDLYKWSTEQQKADKKKAKKNLEKTQGLSIQSTPVRGRTQQPLDTTVPKSLQALPPRLAKAAGKGKEPIKYTKEQQSTARAEPKHPAAHTYENYQQKWENFDVDAALREVDEPKDVQRNDGASSSQNPISGSVQDLQKPVITEISDKDTSKEGQMATSGASQADIAKEQAELQKSMSNEENLSANGWKDRGNLFLKAGDLDEAKACYNKSIAVSATCIAFSNRALVAIKQGQMDEAMRDCSEAIKLDKQYFKAYLRRAAAYRDQDRLSDALSDLEQALLLQPRDLSIKREFNSTLQAVLKDKGLKLDLDPSQVPVEVVSSSDKAEQNDERSTTEVVLQATETAQPSPVQNSSNIVNHDKDGVECAADKQIGDDLSVKQTERASAESQLGKQNEMVIDQNTEQKQSSGTIGTCNKENNVNTSNIVRTQQPTAPVTKPTAKAQKPTVLEPPQQATINNNENYNSDGKDNKALENSSPNLASRDSKSASPTVQAVNEATKILEAARLQHGLDPATSSSQFETEWRNLKNTPDVQLCLALLLPTSNIASVLRNGLSPPILHEVTVSLIQLVTGSADGRAKRAAQVLLSLANMPRFKMSIMCCGSALKQEVSKAVKAGQGDGMHACDLQNILKLYGIQQ